MIGAAAECPALQHLVVRSGIEIYGRGRGALTRPDETAPDPPDVGVGSHRCRDRAHRGRGSSARVGVPVGAVRLAPVLGPHVPSPLGRMLRNPVVPFSVLADPPFAVIKDHDAARAIVAAAREGLAEPVNVVASGAITCLQALRRGRRLPFPLIGPDWQVAKVLSYLFGSPIPDHVAEVLHRGRLADNGRMAELLGVVPESTTSDVIDELYGWPSIIRRPARVAAA